MIIKTGKMLNKKAVSPVVATVLLIVMVIVIGLIIFLWFRSFVPESNEKFGRNIEFACEDTLFQAGYESGTGALTISNTGTVPIYSLEVKITKNKNYITKSITEMDPAWPSLGLRQGEVYTSASLLGHISSPEEVLVIPVLAGTSEEGEQAYVCGEEHSESLTL